MNFFRLYTDKAKQETWPKIGIVTKKITNDDDICGGNDTDGWNRSRILKRWLSFVIVMEVELAISPFRLLLTVILILTPNYQG